MDLPDSDLPRPKTADQLRRELEILKRDHPEQYALGSARLIHELNKVGEKKRFAET